MAKLLRSFLFKNKTHAKTKRMNDSDGKIHYDYMTVRANDISECGHYSAFGWIYIADDSERGGRYSFRRISCPSVQAKLDSMQNECEKLLLKIRKIGEKARLCGVAVAAVTLLIGIVAFINGMNMCIGETFRFNAAVSVAAGVFAFAALAVSAAEIPPFYPPAAPKVPRGTAIKPGEIKITLPGGVEVEPGKFNSSRSLNGNWKFSGLEKAEKAFEENPQGFEAVEFDDSKWDTIAVPLNWYQKYKNF